MPDDYLDAAELRAATFVRHVEIHETLGSTNDRAAELARDAVVELPALIAARHQTAGRGRGTNTWWSAEGALTFSVLLDPAALGISTMSWPQISLAAAVAICDAISQELVQLRQRAGSFSTSIGGGAFDKLSRADALARSNPQSEIRNPESTRLAIKWPNDVMLDDAKLCGILVESPGGAAPAKDRLIIGVGINVNNSIQLGQSDMAARGTSLVDATGYQHSLQTLTLCILRQLKKVLVDLASGDDRLRKAWQRLCWLSQKNIRVASAQNVVEGRCLGIAADGALMINTGSGTESVYSGSVTLL